MLDTHGQVSAAGLSDELGVTHETVRKDLVALQEQGLLKRVHGGAVRIGSVADEQLLVARTQQAEEKARIGVAALQFVPESGAILLDSGSTVAALAACLPVNPRLIAVTNSLPIALALLPKVGSVTTLGGRLRAETHATVDDWTLQHLEAIRTDVVFLGTNALSPTHGLATPDQAESAVKAALVRAARLRVLLADHTKVGVESVYRYADVQDIDVLVSDAGLPAAVAAELERDCGVEVVRAR